MMTVLADQMREQHLLGKPLNATYVSGRERSYLVLSLHGIAGDHVSRDILLTDVFTAFAQRLAGDPIVLDPVTTTWREWLHRCVGLAMHPAVLESRGPLVRRRPPAYLSVAAPAPEPPDAHDLSRLSSELTPEQTGDVDDAGAGCACPWTTCCWPPSAVRSGPPSATARWPSNSADRDARCRPDVDVGRTVGWFTTIYPVVIPAATPRQAGARELLDEIAAIPESRARTTESVMACCATSTRRPPGCSVPPGPPTSSFASGHHPRPARRAVG